MTLSAITFICRDCEAHGHIGGIETLSECPDCGSSRIKFHDEILSLALVHLDCDAFYASIEKRDNPELKGKPVIVGGGNRGVVAAACYVARQYGIRSAMPSWQAHKRCPDLVVIKPRMSLYSTESQKIRQLMLEATPLVEPLSIDEAFLDLSGTQQLHQAPPAIVASRLQKRIYEEIGITVSIGLSGNKSLAKMASDRDKPHGFFTIGMEEAKDWLAPQPITVLYGLGKSISGRLNDAGIHNCDDLVSADRQMLYAITGRDTNRLQNLAQGIDQREVKPNGKAKSISAETTFDKDLFSLADLQAELEPLIFRVSKRLKDKQISGRRITLKLKRANHQILTRSKTVTEPIQQAHLIQDIVYGLLSPEVASGKGYRLIGVGVDSFDDGDTGLQLSLTDTPEKIETSRKSSLEEATDKLRKQLGANAIQSGNRLLYQKIKTTNKKKD